MQGTARRSNGAFYWETLHWIEYTLLRFSLFLTEIWPRDTYPKMQSINFGMDDMCQSISLGKDDLCQSISFGINDLCQKLSAICHQYRTAPHKFRISAGHILTNCFFARPKNVTIFYIYKCPVEENIQHISAGHILTNCFFATSIEVRIYWKEIYNIQILFPLYILGCPAKAKNFFLI